MCKRFTLLIAALASVLGAGAADAVMLSARGMGQVLLYPYYTVNGGQSTLISLVNWTDRAKAIKLRFREGYNGREVASLNLYLSPYDAWSGVVFAFGEGDAANLLSEDFSCTLPALRDNSELPALTDGRHYLPFSKDSYSEANADTGPTSLSRTREGSIEVIEMGELVGPSKEAASHYGAHPPRDCGQLRTAWKTTGYLGFSYWVLDPDTDMAKPGGGLYGALAVVNPAQGTIFEAAATALDGFSAYAQHTAPDSPHPNLSDARSSTKEVQPPYADAEVMLDTGIVRARYVGADRTIDGVSAVLMAKSLHNEYVAETASGANTDWVVSFPTKHYYTDRSLVSAALPPFSKYFGEGVDGESCAEFGFKISDREGSLPTAHVDPQPPPLPPVNLCHETSVISILSGARFGSSPVSRVLSSALTFNILPFASSGVLQLDSDTTTEPHVLRPAADGTVFRGLPAIGFGVVKYINGNVTPGVMANYSAAVPHRSVVACSRANGDCR